VDFIVHVFSHEKRAFYGLERLRKSATSLSVAELNAEIAAAITAGRPAKAGKSVPAKKAAKKVAAKAVEGKKAPAKAAKKAVKKAAAKATKKSAGAGSKKR